MHCILDLLVAGVWEEMFRCGGRESNEEAVEFRVTDKTPLAFLSESQSNRDEGEWEGGGNLVNIRKPEAAGVSD